MIKSMTGFASVTRDDGTAALNVTIRGVNHRFLDLQLRLPQSLAGSESELRVRVGRWVARGRIEVTIGVQLRQAPTPEVELNAEFANALKGAIDRARTEGLVVGALTPGDLLRLPQALLIRERAAETDEGVVASLAQTALAALEDALRDLDAMRAREGAHLRDDLDHRRGLVADLVERVAVAAEEGRADLARRLTERVAQIRAEVQVDDTAVAQEIVRVAARSDISEELARFRGHVAHWALLAGAPEPCGRKLDFLLQEMNREVNTMGSKADGLRVSELVIAAKAELEKLREQVQNVE